MTIGTVVNVIKLSYLQFNVHSCLPWLHGFISYLLVIKFQLTLLNFHPCRRYAYSNDVTRKHNIYQFYTAKVLHLVTGIAKEEYFEKTLIYCII